MFELIIIVRDGWWWEMYVFVNDVLVEESVLVRMYVVCKCCIEGELWWFCNGYCCVVGKVLVCCNLVFGWGVIVLSV